MKINKLSNQIFQEYAEKSAAKITLTTPKGKKVEFVYQEKSGPGGYHQKYNGLFVTAADFEIDNCIATIAHVHFVNSPTVLSGYFEAEMTFGCGEEARTEIVSHLTLEQICELIDKNDWQFSFDLFTNRSIHNKLYWPI
jgi:hypothetical protein